MASLARVSILLVTKNGHRYLSEVLENIGQQRGRLQIHEIIAVDSGSRDRTLEVLERFGVRILQIPPQEFAHGKTRNMAAAQAQGDYLVFLTQDATPAHPQWLENLLAPLQTSATVAGAYSRHLPRPDCHPMEWRRIVQFELSGRAESCLNTAVGNPDYVQNPGVYSFFSNVSSVMRRQVWEKFPLPDVEFGEDQLWARRVLEAGYQTAYCADSLVYHSHSYGPWANLCRHVDHARALHRPEGRSHQMTLTHCVREALSVARADLAFWSRQNGQRKAHVLLRWAVPAVSWHLAANLGLWIGERIDTLPGRLAQFFSLQERIKRGNV
jgi:rhamnosyltransferase